MNRYDEIDKIALNMFNSGNSLIQISRELHIDRGKLSKRMKEKFNIKIVPDGRKYKCDDFIFSSIDSEEKAYWLGFIMADGCIRNDRNIVEVALAEKDKNHLLKLNKFLSSTYKISERNTLLKGKCFKSYRTYFVSKQIIKDLAKYDCVENKTYKIFTVYEFNNFNLDRAYIRGLFDGDGSLSVIKNSSRISKLTFTSHTESMLLSIIMVIEKYMGTLKYKIYSRSKGSYSVQFSMDSVRKVLYFMYNNSSIYLDRKYHIYKAYAVHIGNFMDYEWAKSVKSFMVDNAEESDSASVESRD